MTLESTVDSGGPKWVGIDAIGRMQCSAVFDPSTPNVTAALVKLVAPKISRLLWITKPK